MYEVPFYYLFHILLLKNRIFDIMKSNSWYIKKRILDTKKVNLILYKNSIFFISKYMAELVVLNNMSWYPKQRIYDNKNTEKIDI